MTTPLLSIIISSFKRLEYLRRTLYSIAANPPNCEFQVVIVDEQSDESSAILTELKKYSFDWKFISVDVKEFEKATGLTKYYNNAAWTYNVGLVNSDGKYCAVMGNDVISVACSMENLVIEALRMKSEDFILYSSTFNCPKPILDTTGEYGEKLDWPKINTCQQFVLQSPGLKTLVNNYLSICPKSTLIKINGWNDKFLLGIACEDSLVSMRIINLPNSQHRVLDNVLSIHQQHPTRQFDDNKEFWDRGVSINRAHYYEELKKPVNDQPWPIGVHGIREIIKNY